MHCAPGMQTTHFVPVVASGTCRRMLCRLHASRYGEGKCVWIQPTLFCMALLALSGGREALLPPSGCPISHGRTPQRATRTWSRPQSQLPPRISRRHHPRINQPQRQPSSRPQSQPKPAMFHSISGRQEKLGSRATVPPNHNIRRCWQSPALHGKASA